MHFEQTLSFWCSFFCYQIPFNENFDDLKSKLIEIKREYDVKSEVDARNVFNKISS